MMSRLAARAANIASHVRPRSASSFNRWRTLGATAAFATGSSVLHAHSQRKCFVILGPPGAGKGTQARLLCDAHPDKFVHLEFSQMVRRAVQQQTPAGKEIVSRKENGLGGWLPDDIVDEMVAHAIQQADPEKTLIFDGYPRLSHQMQFLLFNFKVDLVICLLGLSEVDLATRIEHRLFHKSSGRAYSDLTSHRNVEGKLVDEVTNEALERRAEDNPRDFAVRYQDYLRDTVPAIELVKTAEVYLPVNAALGVDAIHRFIEHEASTAYSWSMHLDLISTPNTAKL